MSFTIVPVYVTTFAFPGAREKESATEFPLLSADEVILTLDIVTSPWFSIAKVKLTLELYGTDVLSAFTVFWTFTLPCSADADAEALADGLADADAEALGLLLADGVGSDSADELGRRTDVVEEPSS